MKDVLAWMAVLALMLVLAVCLGSSLKRGESQHRVAALERLSASSFTVSAISEAREINGQGEGRDPFRYAPISESGQYDLIVPDASLASMDFPILELEGVLLRRGKERVFLRFDGHQRALGVGQEIVEGFAVAAIDKESVVITNLWGKSRRYYVEP